jgi:hypothetical protein
VSLVRRERRDILRPRRLLNGSRRPLKLIVRQHVERLSRLIFAAEALVLAYLTFWGLLFSLASLLGVVVGPLTRERFVEAVIGALVLFGLLCAWRLALAFLFSTRDYTRKLLAPWWFGASAIAVASVLVAVYSRLIAHNTSFAESSFGILEYGVLFVPSYIHLTAEVWLRAV